MNERISNRLKHFFHVVSNVRPIVWIGTYVAITPIFALIYMALPDGQFRIPDGAGTDYGSWLYYSIVTITTLGFGDYTPAHGWAQAVTAVEVMCGLIFLGLFLNAVGAMKSEIDVESEIEKQKRMREAANKAKLVSNIPALMHSLNTFMAYCYAVTTPQSKRAGGETRYDPDFTLSDMADMFKPSRLPSDGSHLPAVERLLQSASRTSIAFDSLQSRIDLSQWPELLENSFSFVAEFQMFSSTDLLTEPSKSFYPSSLSADVAEREKALSSDIAAHTGDPDASVSSELRPVVELYHFIKKNAALALKLESDLTTIASDGAVS